MVALAVPPLRSYVDDVLSGRDSSTLAHLKFLESHADRDYSILWDELGSSGAAAGVTTESAIVTVVEQLGVIGSLGYCAIYRVTCLRGASTMVPSG